MNCVIVTLPAYRTLNWRELLLCRGFALLADILPTNVRYSHFW